MYDLIIVGGGPAGHTAAEHAGKAGLSTLLIEKSDLGGVCLNEGCIPSKTLLHCVKLYSAAKSSASFGVNASGVTFDLGPVMARKRKVVETLRNGIASTLAKSKVETCGGTASILGKSGEAFKVAAAGKEYEAKRLLVCTGSEAVRLGVPGADRDFVLTNREILSVSSVPASIVIVGGGAIGLEFASFFAEAGSSVAVIEMLETIGGRLDRDIASALRRELEKKGIKFYMQSRVTEIGDHAVTFNDGAALRTLAADVVLMSVGRRPVTAGFGLETLGVAVERGAIKTDARCRTNVPGVWAAGDVNGVSMLAHTAFREGRVAVHDMLGLDDTVNYDAIPSVIYTHPEAATVGLTKDEAAARGFTPAEGRLPLTFNGRYLAEADAERGSIRVVADSKSRRLLGVHMVGGGCSELIWGAAAMLERGLTLEDVAAFVFPHPTVSEVIGDAMAQVK
jgi:dihydrolipoamide dehydrogenase